MNRVLLAFIILVDALCIVATWPMFASEPTAETVGWGIVIVVIFSALVVLLLTPKLFGSNVNTAAKFICAAVPAIVFVGSLDGGRISGQEIYAIIFAALIGWLNWAAFIRNAAIESNEAT